MTLKQLKRAMKLLKKHAFNPDMPLALSTEYYVLSTEYEDLLDKREEDLYCRAAIYVYEADDQYDIQFDAKPKVSISPLGAWVQGWLWVPKDILEEME